MNKNKGFTLIELLAVIVILAILMVISVPKILNVIENSKKSAAESSIKLLKDAIRSQVASEGMMDANFTSDESGCYTFNFDNQTSGNAKELQLKNKENITGTIKYCNGYFASNKLHFNGEDMSTIVCKRANDLHTINGITYGNPIITENELKSGDAFDCNVNGDKTYDSETERFYYVTDMDDSTAVLIYYNNVSKGKPSNSTTYAYDASGKNWYGPRTAIEELPSTNEWRNVSLKNSVRAILNENGGNTTKGETLSSNFSYSGKAARLLTIQEVRKATGIDEIPTWQVGELDNFNYLLENTKYSNASNAADAWWLENPHSGHSAGVWLVNGGSRIVSNDTCLDTGDYGVRPAIEVPKSNIEY